MLAKVINRHDVGVVDAGDRLGLTLKAFDEFLVLVEGLVEDLNRHYPVEADLATLINRAHAALPDALNQVIAANGFSEVGVFARTSAD